MSSTSLVSFSYENQPLRVEKDEDGEPLFHAGDLCAILGYANPWDAIRRHVAEEDRVKREALSAGGMQLTNFVREPGMWSLILGSETEAAKPVKRWVTAEVLPSIRKTCSYTMPGTTPSSQPISFVGKRWMAYCDCSGWIMTEIPADAMTLRPHQWVDALKTPDFPAHLLSDVLAAVSERMKGLPGGGLAVPLTQPTRPADKSAGNPAGMPDVQRHALEMIAAAGAQGISKRAMTTNLWAFRMLAANERKSLIEKMIKDGLIVEVKSFNEKTQRSSKRVVAAQFAAKEG